MDSGKKCWICHDSSGSLLTNFCHCTGTLGNVHQSCLQHFADTQHINSCPTCRQPYQFLFLGKHGGSPPPQPDTALHKTWFLLAHFIGPVAFCAVTTAIELLLHWFCAPVLVGAMLYTFSYSFEHNDSFCWDAWLVGVVMCVLKRKIDDGAETIWDITTAANNKNNSSNAVTRQQPANETATTTTAATAQQRLGTADDEQQLDGDDREHHPQEQAEVQRDDVIPVTGAEDPTNVVNEDDAGGDDDGNDENDDDDDDDEEEDDVDDDEGPASNTNQTLDRIAWKALLTMRLLARYPRPTSALDALWETLTSDLPILIVVAAAIGWSPLLVVCVAAVIIIESTLRCTPPALADPKDRYNEAKRRMKTESRDEDRYRYLLIYCLDAIILYIFLPLVCGVVAHEALDGSGIIHATTTMSVMHPAQQEQNQIINNTCDSSSSSVNNTANSNTTMLLSCTFAAPAEVLSGFVGGVARRLAATFDRPFISLLHWMFGYVVAGCISCVEALFVAPVFAPGVSLIFFRAIHITEEHSSFTFMIVQLFDVSALSGMSHCAKLFASYAPLVGCSIWLLTNALRCFFAFGHAATSALIAASSAAPLCNNTTSIATHEQQNVMQRQISDSSNMSSSIPNFWSTAMTMLQNSTIVQSIRTDFVQSFWHVTHPYPQFPSWWFVLSCALVVVAGGAFYALPHQFIVLRRVMPVMRFAAHTLGLDKFLFDDQQMQNVDQFLQICAGLPVRAENVVELVPATVPIAQSAIRRERFMEASDVPTLLQLRVFAFTMFGLVKFFAIDWVQEVALPMLLFGSVKAVLAFSAKYRDYAYAALQTQMSLLLLFYGNNDATDLLLANESNDVDLHAELFPTTGGGCNSSGSASAASPQQTNMTMTTTTTTTMTMMNPAAHLFLPSGSFSGLDLLALSFLVCLRYYPRALGLSAGYVLVTPVALVFGVLELFKPAIVNLRQVIESVWQQAFEVRRVVIPRVVATPVAAGSSATSGGGMSPTAAEAAMLAITKALLEDDAPQEIIDTKPRQ